MHITNFFKQLFFGTTDELRLESIKYDYANGSEFNKHSCEFACENGHIESLKFLITHGCEYDITVCKQLAKNNNVADYLAQLH